MKCMYLDIEILGSESQAEIPHGRNLIVLSGAEISGIRVLCVADITGI